MAARRLAVAHHEREIAFAVLAQPLPGRQQMLRVKTGFDALCELYLIGGVEQSGLADAVQIHAHQISGWTLSVQILVEAA
jgi:hypothetical protein